MSSTCFKTPIRVYIEDTDAGGIVYYVNYLKYMERARTEFFRALGYAKPAFIASGLLIVVASVEVDYKKPAKLDDDLRATAEVIRLAKTYVVFEQKILRNEEVLSAAKVKVACVGAENVRPAALPEDVRDKLLPWVKRA